jgi:hypothetical protein
MKNIIRLEEAAMLALAIYLNSLLPFGLAVFGLLFLAPDIGMLGYLVNNKVGALTYNILHHKGIAIALYLIGLYVSNQELQFTGVLLFGHSSFDRMLGYGLKHSDQFHNTHLGLIGKAAK